MRSGKEKVNAECGMRNAGGVRSGKSRSQGVSRGRIYPTRQVGESRSVKREQCHCEQCHCEPR